MADNIVLNPGTAGDTTAADDIGGVKFQRVKLIHGADGVNAGDVATANPLPIGDAGGSLTVDGTVAATQSGTWNVATVTTLTGITNVVQVGDNSGSITVDDGAGSLTVDGTVAISGTVTVDSELTTADLDTGAGTDTRAVVGLALAASGGALLVGSANPMPISDNSGSITVDGTLAATQSGTWNVATVTAVTSITNAVAVTDNSGSLTVDGTVAFSNTTIAVTNAGTFLVQAAQSGTWNVGTVASITAAVAVTDNSGSLTVDGTVAFSNTTIAVTNAGTFAVQAAQSGTWNVATVSTVTAVTDITNWGNVVDNAGFTDGTTRLLCAGFIFDEVSGTALTENDVAAARIDAKRAQVLTLEDETTRGQRLQITAAKAARVDIAATAAVLADNTANPTTSLIGACLLGYDGTTWDRIYTVADGDAVAAGTKGFLALGTDGTNYQVLSTNSSGQPLVAQAGTWTQSLAPNTTGGLTTYSLISAATTNATVVKASAGKLYSLYVSNVNAAVMYLKFYDKATTPSEADTPVLRLAIPGLAAGKVEVWNTEQGLTFASGISFRTTTAVADASTAAVAANEILLNAGFK